MCDRLISRIFVAMKTCSCAIATNNGGACAIPFVIESACVWTPASLVATCLSHLISLSFCPSTPSLNEVANWRSQREHAEPVKFPAVCRMWQLSHNQALSRYPQYFMNIGLRESHIIQTKGLKKASRQRYPRERYNFGWWPESFSFYSVFMVCSCVLFSNLYSFPSVTPSFSHSH